MTPALAVVLSIAAAGVLVENIVASQHIIRDGFGTFSQKLMQFLFVWLVPVVGAAIVIFLSRSNLEPGAGNYGPEKEEPDEDLVVSKIDYSSTD